jgi:hypothetical protein
MDSTAVDEDQGRHGAQRETGATVGVAAADAGVLAAHVGVADELRDGLAEGLQEVAFTGRLDVGGVQHGHGDGRGIGRIGDVGAGNHELLQLDLLVFLGGGGRSGRLGHCGGCETGAQKQSKRSLQIPYGMHFHSLVGCCSCVW